MSEWKGLPLQQATQHTETKLNLAPTAPLSVTLLSAMIPRQLDFKLCHVLTAFLDIKSTKVLVLHTVCEFNPPHVQILFFLNSLLGPGLWTLTFPDERMSKTE
jgi:hypothetical protein